VPDFVARVTTLNDRALADHLAPPGEVVRPGDVTPAAGHRRLLKLVKTAVVAFSDERSRWFAADAALAAVPGWLSALTAQQLPSGLFSSDGNLDSPPDTSFSINDMGIVHRLTTTATGDLADRLAPTRTALAQVMATATDALVRGGVHTPNHRWELASALAWLDAVRPDPSVRARIDQWLAEQVDVDTDGLYSERSPNYAAHVTNPSLLTLAAHLDRPDLRAVVHRSLHAQAALTDADGLVETVHSRRQDQGRPFAAGPFAAQYRRFALLDDCPTCAAAARVAEPYVADEAVDVLAEMLLEPALTADLPAPPPPADPTHAAGPDVRTFAAARLVKISHARSVTTVYGGSDVPRTGRIASGLACDPTFLRWRHGAVVLDAVRLSRTFFGLGPFRAQEVVQVDTDPPVFRLTERLRAGYYQPLGPGFRRADGDYELQDEGRFSAALAFTDRDRDEVELSTEITVTAADTTLNLDLGVDGAATGYAVELTFRPGGELSGVQDLPRPDCFELVEGLGSYRVGDDVVTFGPGTGPGAGGAAGYDPGSAYTVPGGTDATTGVRVYLTGRTPGRRRLVLRGS
jgi:hypothetical protein